MRSKSITLETLEKTQLLGKLLGEYAIPGDVYCLDGDLGAGKTTLTQAIAKGLAVPENYYITSPTFNILHEYPGRIPLYHMDLYRIEGEDGVIDMGLEEFFYLKGLTVIEWSRKAQQILPDNSLSLHIAIAEFESREVVCEYRNKYWQGRFEKLIRKIIESD